MRYFFTLVFSLLFLIDLADFASPGFFFHGTSQEASDVAISTEVAISTQAVHDSVDAEPAPPGLSRVELNGSHIGPLRVTLGSERTVPLIARPRGRLTLSTNVPSSSEAH